MWWGVLKDVFLWGLLLGPGVLLGWRFFGRRRIGWPWVLALSLLLGWASVVALAWSHREELTWAIESFEARGEDVSDNLMTAWASDASSVFAVYFGWVPVLPVLGAWLIVFALARGVRGWAKMRKAKCAHKSA